MLGENQKSRPDVPAGEVWVEETGEGLVNNVWMVSHHLLADEPVASGGQNMGPNPYSYLLTALGACTSITLRMYARHKQIPLQQIRVKLRHRKINVEDCSECETKTGVIDEIERSIELTGDLDETQRQHLLGIANKCPLHKTLTSEIWVLSALVPSPLGK
jgi:putative redox protein